MFTVTAALKSGLLVRPKHYHVWSYPTMAWTFHNLWKSFQCLFIGERDVCNRNITCGAMKTGFKTELNNNFNDQSFGMATLTVSAKCYLWRASQLLLWQMPLVITFTMVKTTLTVREARRFRISASLSVLSHVVRFMLPSAIVSTFSRQIDGVRRIA